MSIFNNLFKKNKKESTEVTQAPVEDKDEIAAVIAAAISIVLKKGTNEFIVRNIKRTPEMDSIWAHEGRMKLMQ